MALWFKKSQRWVYQYAHELGGFRIGGSWVFTKKGVEDALQRRKTMESYRNIQEDQVSGNEAYKKRRRKMGSEKTKGVERKRKAWAKRHNLD